MSLPAGGIVLYGAPASGKDTVTHELTALDPRYVHFQRLKAGGGRTEGYRVCDNEQIEDLRAKGLIVYENERYDSRYAIDLPALDALLTRDLIPVVHLGQLAGVHALMRHPALWLPVMLHCRRATAAQRARQRGSDDIDARLQAWDDTAQDLAHAQPEDFALRIDTDRTSPASAARSIDTEFRRLQAPRPATSRR
jgi:guanylate kinase